MENYFWAVANYSAGVCSIYNLPKFKTSMYCKWFLFECLKMFSEANHLWTAINLDPGITCTICRPAGLIYCWWILFSTFQTLYCVKCHIKLCRGTLRVVSFASFILCFTNVTHLYCYCHSVRSFITSLS